MEGREIQRVSKKRYFRYLAMTFFLVLFLCVVSICAAKYSSDLAIRSCFQKLHDSTVQYAGEIRRDVESDSAVLQALADYLSDGALDKPEEFSQLFSLFKAGKGLDSAGLILPDGRIYLEDESWREALASVSYAEEAAKGARLSGRLKAGEHYYLCHFIPIQKDGKTQGLLCGIIDLDKPGRQYAKDLEEGTSVYLIEGKSGALLADTMEAEPEAGEILPGRIIKRVDGKGRVLRDMEEGKAGQASYFSESSRETYYCVYEPVGVNDWMLMLGQPESLALRDAESIRASLRGFTLFQITVFLLYLVFSFFAARRELRQKERELDRVQYILEIEKILFNSAGTPGLIEEALREIAVRHDAETAFFIVYEEDGSEIMYLWSGKNQRAEEKYTKADFPVLCASLLEKGELLFYGSKELPRDSEAEYQLLNRIGIESLAGVPVRKPDGTHVGSLGVVNMKRTVRTTQLLKWVMLSFSMAIQNITAFRAIKEMGSRDQLTGLKNRNSYQKALEGYEKEQDPSLSCIYVDADGLHEINNQYGHEAGDLLLRTVADVLKKEFDRENLYRIGGDELVAFCHDLDSGQVDEKICNAKDRLKKKGYHISVGTERWEATPFVYEMIKQAEMKMYAEKRRYHEAKDDGYTVREMDRKLEKTLMKKRDMDVFCSILSSQYLGVYIVDLQIDTFRYIYIPSYFNDAAEQSSGKFSMALRIYAEGYVGEDCRGQFLRLLDYRRIEEYLNRDEKPELSYVRPDGERILLKIYRSPEYGENCRECIWTFEKEG